MNTDSTRARLRVLPAMALAVLGLAASAAPAALAAPGDLISKSQIDIDAGDDYAADMARQADGKVLIASQRLARGADLHWHEAPVISRYGAQGLDKTFGDNGTAFVSPIHEGDEMRVNSIIPRPDGTILVSLAIWNGDDYSRLASVIRLLPDGALDKSYGDDGLATLGKDVAVTGMVVDKGRVVLSGTVRNPDTGMDQRVVVARFTSDGHLDPTFSGDGQGVYKVTAGGDHSAGVAIDSKGRVLLGTSPDLGGRAKHSEFNVLALDETGSVDRSFGRKGVASIRSDQKKAVGGYVTGMQVLPNGRIAVIGSSRLRVDFDDEESRWAVGMLTASGKPDRKFAGGHLALVRFGKTYSTSPAPQDIAVDGKGRLVLAGEGYGPAADSFAVARFTRRGDLDRSFGRKGKVGVRFGAESRAVAVQVLPSGRILALGHVEVDHGDSSDLALAAISDH